MAMRKTQKNGIYFYTSCNRSCQYNLLLTHHSKLNDEQTLLYFCSKRDNEQFDIYNITLSEGELLHDFLGSSEPGEITVETVLSGDGNDKYPFIKPARGRGRI
jgi:hypothetical protein